jgi:DMSO/TMAO reductase YedYZ heme-binding membrane subunit
LRWTLFLLAAEIVIVGTGPSAWDTVAHWISAEHDRLPWYVTRITALLAYLAFFFSVTYGLLLSTKLLDRIAHRAVSFTLHQDLSSIAVALALVHGAVLMIDRTMPYSLPQVVVPFTGPYRPVWVGIGQITLGLALLVLLSFHVRRRIGQARWRKLHYLTFLVFVGATVHGLMAGSDSSADWVRMGYVVMAAVVVFLTSYRMVLSVASRGEFAAPSKPVSRTEGRATGGGPSVSASVLGPPPAFTPREAAVPPMPPGMAIAPVTPPHPAGMPPVADRVPSATREPAPRVPTLPEMSP